MGPQIDRAEWRTRQPRVLQLWWLSSGSSQGPATQTMASTHPGSQLPLTQEDCLLFPSPQLSHQGHTRLGSSQKHTTCLAHVTCHNRQGEALMPIPRAYSPETQTDLCKKDNRCQETHRTQGTRVSVLLYGHCHPQGSSYSHNITIRSGWMADMSPGTLRGTQNTRDSIYGTWSHSAQGAAR